MPRRVNWPRLKLHRIRPTLNSNVSSASGTTPAIGFSKVPPARLGVITIRTNNGMRFGWMTNTSRPDVPTFRNVDEVFPRNDDLPDPAHLTLIQQEFDEVIARGNPNQIVLAMEARDASSAVLAGAFDAQEKRNALSNAIRRDALKACAR